MDLADNTFALTNWQNHAEIVKRTAILRELIYAAAQINALAYDAPDDLNQVVEEAEKTLFNVTEKRVSSTFAKMDTLLTEDAFEELTKPVRAAATTWPACLRASRTRTPCSTASVAGDLVILAARPGVGKTSFALNLAVNAAKSGAAVAFFSLEMSAEQLVQRILCAEARVSLSQDSRRLHIRGGLGRHRRRHERAFQAGPVHRRLAGSLHPGSTREGAPRTAQGPGQGPHHR